ncbi:MAG: hypothetical protein GX617_15740 [Lentisphaerae bacterium]|nr:hypothetical protein [Lentisphaerota bacterium]
MSEQLQTIHRVTCAIRRERNHGAMEQLGNIGLRSVFVESGRCVRRRRRGRPFGLPGFSERLEDSPIDVIHFSVPPELSEPVVQRLASALQINQPGHGTIFTQECRSFFQNPLTAAAPIVDQDDYPPGLLRDLALITCITSISGTGEELARVALELGTGVPVVTLGAGTGLRDRLGLLRITVPAEKEVIRLLVPAWDAEGLMRMLIEKGRLNRPGRGFIYCSPVAAGILDTSLLVGPQQHAATIEQVVAAIDRLEKSTAWRRRFPVLDPDSGFSLQSRSEKITLICQEEFAGKYADVAIAAGAGAATSARLQQISLGDAPGGACERCTFVVRSAQSKDILNALTAAQDDIGVTLESLDVEPVDFSFSYRAEASRFFRRGGAQSS